MPLGTCWAGRSERQGKWAPLHCTEGRNRTTTTLTRRDDAARFAAAVCPRAGIQMFREDKGGDLAAVRAKAPRTQRDDGGAGSKTTGTGGRPGARRSASAGDGRRRLDGQRRRCRMAAPQRSALHCPLPLSHGQLPRRCHPCIATAAAAGAAPCHWPPLTVVRPSSVAVPVSVF